MKKTLMISVLALGLGLTSAFASEGWNYYKYNSKIVANDSGCFEETKECLAKDCPTMSNSAADTTSQNSKTAVLAVNKSHSQQMGKMTVVQAEKGDLAYERTVVVTR